MFVGDCFFLNAFRGLDSFQQIWVTLIEKPYPKNPDFVF